MGTTQKLDTDMSAYDHRCDFLAANDSDTQSPDFLDGVQVIDLEIEVIIL